MEKTRRTSTRSPAILEMLKAKYLADPEGFRAYLPEIARILDDILRRGGSHRSPFVLTEGEREFRRRSLKSILEGHRKAAISRAEAIQAIEHCAALIEDFSLPPEVERDVLVNFIRAVIGKSPGAVRAIDTVQITENRELKVERHVSILRGVTLNVSWDVRLVSVTLNPEKMRERNKALRFVGIARDLPDVVREHDKYLALEDSRAAS